MSERNMDLKRKMYCETYASVPSAITAVHTFCKSKMQFLTRVHVRYIKQTKKKHG